MATLTPRQQAARYFSPLSDDESRVLRLARCIRGPLISARSYGADPGAVDCLIQRGYMVEVAPNHYALTELGQRKADEIEAKQ